LPSRWEGDRKAKVESNLKILRTCPPMNAAAVVGWVQTALKSR
jgi:hypothetical protein